MLRCARNYGLRTVAKNVTESNCVLPKVCGTTFFNDLGKNTRSDKNDRFWRKVLALGFCPASEVKDRTSLNFSLPLDMKRGDDNDRKKDDAEARCLHLAHGDGGCLPSIPKLFHSSTLH